MAIKRCPTCHQEFTDEWLTFCTNDGTSLVTVERSSEEPPPTIVSGSMPPSVSPLEQPTLDLPGVSFRQRHLTGRPRVSASSSISARSSAARLESAAAAGLSVCN